MVRGGPEEAIGLHLLQQRTDQVGDISLVHQLSHVFCPEDKAKGQSFGNNDFPFQCPRSVNSKFSYDVSESK